MIVNADIAAGHDGAAELVLTLRYASGAQGQVTLDGPRGFALMKRCAADQASDLRGQPWTSILESLECTTF